MNWTKVTSYLLEGTTLEVVPTSGGFYYVVDWRAPQVALSDSLSLASAKARAERIATQREAQLAERGGML